MEDESIRIIRSPITGEELRAFLDNPFPELVKCVVDIEEEIVAIGGELHSDAEEIMLEEGSLQRNLWGGNIYPDGPPGDRLEFSALMNIRPSQDNRSMEVENQAVKEKMREIVMRLIPLLAERQGPLQQIERPDSDHIS